MKAKSKVPILIADDDRDDCDMIRDALVESRLINELFYVNDGEELLDFLNHRGKFSDADKYPTPGLILLDLNMPKKDGRKVLVEVRSNPELNHIPILIFTTSGTAAAGTTVRR